MAVQLAIWEKTPQSFCSKHLPARGETADHTLVKEKQTDLAIEVRISVSYCQILQDQNMWFQQCCYFYFFQALDAFYKFLDIKIVLFTHLP